MPKEEQDERSVKQPKSASKKIQVEFFKYENGAEPVRDWLKKELNDEDRKQVGADIGLIEYEWPVNTSLVKKVGKFWEVRSIVSVGWESILYCG